MKKHLIFLIGLASIVLISCNEETITDSNATMARVMFKLTDAPADYDQVNIDLVGVQIIVDDSIINLDVNAGIYNLLDFVNGKDTMIADQQIPQGELSQIRLILGENNTIHKGSQSFDMKTPSAQQSGLKLNVHTSFVRGITYEYVIDFDASRSIVETGNGKFILKPVLKVFTKAIGGAIEGIVSPAKAKPLIYAISTQSDTSSTFADTLSGKFTFRGLGAGTYNISFLPVAPYNDSTLHNIIVNTGMVTKLDTLKFK